MVEEILMKVHKDLKVQLENGCPKGDRMYHKYQATVIEADDQGGEKELADFKCIQCGQGFYIEL